MVGIRKNINTIKLRINVDPRGVAKTTHTNNNCGTEGVVVDRVDIVDYHTDWEGERDLKKS